MRRILTPDCTKRSYVPSADKPPQQSHRIHAGQRKLLLSEIEFLTLMLEQLKHSPKKLVVVYAGAAPGSHIPLLQNMFSVIHHWVMYDPRPFCGAIYKMQRRLGDDVFSVREDFFTSTEAFSLARQFPSHSYDLLFVCDIRRDAMVADEIKIDMQDQERWCMETEAVGSMLKFRLPFPDEQHDDCVNYLKGDVYLPVWGPRNTTECRLVVRKRVMPGDIGAQEYSCKTIEEQLCFFNNEMRENQGYDFAAQTLIIGNYLRSSNNRRRANDGQRYNKATLVEQIGSCCHDTRKFEARGHGYREQSFGMEVAVVNTTPDVGVTVTPRNIFNWDKPPVVYGPELTFDRRFCEEAMDDPNWNPFHYNFDPIIQPDCYSPYKSHFKNNARHDRSMPPSWNYMYGSLQFILEMMDERYFFESVGDSAGDFIPDDIMILMEDDTRASQPYDKKYSMDFLYQCHRRLDQIITQRFSKHLDRLNKSKRLNQLDHYAARKLEDMSGFAKRFSNVTMWQFLYCMACFQRLTRMERYITPQDVKKPKNLVRCWKPLFSFYTACHNQEYPLFEWILIDCPVLTKESYPSSTLENLPEDESSGED